LAFVTRDFLSLPKRRAAASRAPQSSVIQRLGLFPLASLPNGVDGLLALARCGGISRIIVHIRSFGAVFVCLREQMDMPERLNALPTSPSPLLVFGMRKLFAIF
jgi:hypothetical protein